MRRVWLVVAALLVMAQAPPRPKGLKRAPERPKVERPQVERYDPENLGPGEAACGRIGSKRAGPCGCMKHRLAIREREHAACDRLAGEERIRCHMAVDPCPVVADAEYTQYNEQGERMPALCKRTCTRARCECCHS